MANNTVKNPASEVFDIWGEHISQIVGENNYTMGNSQGIAVTPFAKIKMLGNPGHRYDLAGDELSTTITFQVESYADGTYAISDAYDIDSASHEIMTDMGFRRSYGAELIDNVDSSIKRVVSRYTRTYTGEPLI